MYADIVHKIAVNNLEDFETAWNGIVIAYDGNVPFGTPKWKFWEKDTGYASRLATNQHGIKEVMKAYDIQYRKPMGKVVYYNGK